MSDIAASTHGSGGVVDLDHKPPIAGRLALMAVLLAGLAFTAMNITSDINHAGEPLGVLALLRLDPADRAGVRVRQRFP